MKIRSAILEMLHDERCMKQQRSLERTFCNASSLHQQLASFNETRTTKSSKDKGKGHPITGHGGPVLE